MINKIIIVILAILISIGKLQASTFSYQYDANGNRISKTIL